jgi:hypothetical protein
MAPRRTSSARGRNEDVEHLGGADAVQHLDAGGLLPELARGVGQALARAHADAQRGRPTLRGKRRHLPVERGRGVADGGAHLAMSLRHGLGRVGNVGKVHRGTRPHRKHQQAAQAEGERQRRRAHHDVVGRGLAAHGAARPRRPPAHRGGVCTAALGLPVVPEVKAMQRDVVRRRGAGREVPALGAAIASSEVPRIIRCVEAHDGLQHRVLACACSSSSSSLASHSATWLRLVDDVAQLARAQQRHGGHRHQPGLDHGQPGQRHAHELPPRSSTRLPGTRPRSCVSTWAMRSTRSRACA